MKVTLPYAREQFGLFNEQCFGGVLPEVPIVITGAVSYLGMVRYKRSRKLFSSTMEMEMRLSEAFELREDEIQDVILHEMIHCFIAFKKLRDTSAHGRIFRGMMVEINEKFGRHIRVSHKISPDTVSSRMSRQREHFICITTLKDGSKGITVCSEAMAPVIHRGLSRAYPVLSCEWYRSDDLWFNRFPHSRKPRIYRISSPSELSSHLSSSTPVAAGRTGLR